MPLAWWAYDPKAWLLGQVALIETLLGWVAPAIPPDVKPLVQADRGIGGRLTTLPAPCESLVGVALESNPG